MIRSLPVLLTTIAVLVVAAACSNEPDGSNSGFQPIGDGPAGIEDAVQHLAQEPPFPSPVTDDPELVELRSPEVNRRHHFYLADLEQDGSLGDELIPGAVVRLAEDVTLSVPGGASVAGLAGDTVTEVTECPSPCQVTGPALVAPPEWLQRIRVAPDWLLLVPAPAE